MPHLPTTLAESLTPVTPDLLYDDVGRAALQQLQTAGYAVCIGLRPDDLPQVQAIANQNGVQEFCPNDLRTRFGSLPMATKWQEKGRLFFQLRKLGQAGLAGYGWTGPETCDHLPDCDNTFAVRLSEAVAGQGLANLFTTVIVSGSMAQGMRRIGLETWASNIAAWKAYQHAGAKLVHEEPGKRLAIVQRGRRIRRRQIADVRRFMCFTQTFVD